MEHEPCRSLVPDPHRGSDREAVQRDRSPAPRFPGRPIGPIVGVRFYDSRIYVVTLWDLLFWYAPRKLWGVMRWRLFRWRTAFRHPPWRVPFVVDAEFEEGR